MTNLLEAIHNISKLSSFEIKNLYMGRNRANTVGEALEKFIKDAFADTLENHNEIEVLQKYSEIFSWLGNQNHPPDIMIKGGDAIEVKKTQTASSDLALNSSYPKSNIQASSNFITNDCRICENWTEKDIIYSVGHTSDEKLHSLWFVYGDIYCAKHETYQVIKQKISEGINEIPNVELAPTNELGRVNRVDPLGITNLRIRGMWQIQNPRKVFNYLHTPNNRGVDFELVAILSVEKYNSFPAESKVKIENSRYISIENSRVKNPNNPAQLIDVKVIKWSK
ncbi:hypothetical protein CAPN001_15340 [Capnocytophaga stomatis]|uniref:NgoPII family restriction endonuclease n=1 Tax=Capnocytophaga stomatis TaxID=1848904 RepID=UPI001950ECD7|nr:NgoPII family restriction endonuclease [Capnocytophaga stomatis]GIJ96965.1 hypothetical protein CAPN001_15340 [Capnocytophaga stomatis]